MPKKTQGIIDKVKMKKSIFRASFEESLNLLDDSVSGKFAQENYQDALKKEKYRGTSIDQNELLVESLS